MRGSLCLNVAKGHAPIVLVEYVSWELAIDDLFENRFTHWFTLGLGEGLSVLFSTTHTPWEFLALGS